MLGVFNHVDAVRVDAGDVGLVLDGDRGEDLADGFGDLAGGFRIRRRVELEKSDADRAGGITTSG